MIEERQRTLEEWYDRSLVDTSTFDAESRRQIQEVVDDSEDVYGSAGDIREFFERAVEAFGGEFEKRGTNLYQAELPEDIRPANTDATFGRSRLIASSRWTTRILCLWRLTRMCFNA